MSEFVDGKPSQRVGCAVTHGEGDSYATILEEKNSRTSSLVQ